MVAKCSRYAIFKNGLKSLLSVPIFTRKTKQHKQAHMNINLYCGGIKELTPVMPVKRYITHGIRCIKVIKSCFVMKM